MKNGQHGMKNTSSYLGNLFIYRLQDANVSLSGSLYIKIKEVD